MQGKNNIILFWISNSNIQFVHIQRLTCLQQVQLCIY